MSDLKWKPTIQNIRKASQELPIRNICLIHKIWYVQIYVLSKLWCTAQIKPIEDKYIREINGAISYCIWARSIVRVPLTTLQNEKRRRGSRNDRYKIQMQSIIPQQGIQTLQSRRVLLELPDHVLLSICRYPTPPPPYIQAVPPELQYLCTFIQE
jgi:hypothetical protein